MATFYYYEGSNDAWFKVENGHRKEVSWRDVPEENLTIDYRPIDVVNVGGKWFKRDPSIEAQADAFRLQAYEKLL